MAEQQLNSETSKNRFSKLFSKLQVAPKPAGRKPTPSQPASKPTGKKPASKIMPVTEGVNQTQSASETQSASGTASPASPGMSQTSPRQKSPQPPQKTPPQKPVQPTPPPDRHPWRWSLLALMLLGILGGTGVTAVVWLVTLPPPPDCAHPDKLTLDGERLYCARESARSGELPKLIAGLDLVKHWDKEHPLQSEAQKLQEEWSAQLLRIARGKVMQSDLKGAIAIISHIPKSTKTYAAAQESLAYWNKQWKAGEAVVAKVHASMKQQKWDNAYQQMRLLDDFSQDYWRITRAGQLAQQLGAERQAWQVYNQAKKVAEDGTGAHLNQAIVLSQKVPPQTFAGADAKVQVQKWSQALLAMGISKWLHGDTTTAVTLLRLPDDIQPRPEIADLLHFGSAYRLAGQVSSRWLPSLSQIWDMTEAIAAIQQIKPDSVFYGQSKLHQQSWQAQLQDMVQLQYATAVASLGQRSSLQLAIAQAKEVGADRPRRGQAQTLISFWGDEVERLEDQPYLSQAEAIAKSDKIPDLKAAIAVVSQIAKGRSLRGRSQDLIATWRDRIQTIEDQPMLDQAIALAGQGDLANAIDHAVTIQEGRALYAKAQGLVSDWRAQQIVNAQIAADRPILDRAMAQAESGDLSLAISTASQISPGRVLYNQARESIDRWRRALEPAPRNDFSPSDGSFGLPPIDSNSPEASPSGSPDSQSPDPQSPDSNLPNNIELVPPNPEPSTNNNSTPADNSTPAAPPPVVVDPIPVPSQPSPEERLLRPRASYEGYYDDRYYQRRH